MGEKKENLKKTDVSSDNIISKLSLVDIENVLEDVLSGDKQGYHDTRGKLTGCMSRENLISVYKENPRYLYSDWADYSYRRRHWT